MKKRNWPPMDADKRRWIKKRQVIARERSDRGNLSDHEIATASGLAMTEGWCHCERKRSNLADSKLVVI